MFCFFATFLQHAGSAPGEFSFHFLNQEDVDIQGDLSLVTSEPSIIAYSAQELRSMEERALSESTKAVSNLNLTAPLEAQQAFDALNRTLPCRWEGHAIVVNEMYLVDSPYDETAVQMLPGSSTSTLATQGRQRVVLTVRYVFF